MEGIFTKKFKIFILASLIFSLAFLAYIDESFAQYVVFNPVKGILISNTITINTGSAGSMSCQDDNSCFNPYEIVIEVGDTVTFDNDDHHTHTIKSGTPTNLTTQFATSGIPDGGNEGVTISDSGVILFYSDNRNYMRGKILSGPVVFFDEFEQPGVPSRDYVFEHTPTITVVDKDRDNTGNIDTVNVEVDSNVFGKISVDLAETHTNSGVFQNTVLFKQSGSDIDANVNSFGELRVDPNDTITVKYIDGSSALHTDSANIVPSNMPAGNGIFTGAPNPLSCSSFGTGLDDDGDAICDDWESPSNDGIKFIASSGTEFHFPCDSPGLIFDDCPTTEKKDIYVEVDWMRNHRPDVETLKEIIKVFRDSPAPNPGSVTGITLHIQLDEEIDDIPDIPIDGNSQNKGFYQLRDEFFGTEFERKNKPADYIDLKAQVFHYALFGHSISTNSDASGYAEIPGGDIFITLGNFEGGVGSEDQKAGTFMHELGHNLGLLHGGGDWLNCKPNYPSVMSYVYQFSDYDKDRPLDYSNDALPSLIEGNLDEGAGVGTYSPQRKIFFGPASPLQPSTSQDLPSLVSYWKFANNADDEENLHDGTVGGSTFFESGVNGFASTYSGSPDHILINHQTTLDLSEFSVAFWVKKDSEQSNFNHIISRYNGPGSAGEGGWTFDTLNDGGGITGIRFVVTDSTGNKASGRVPLVIDDWKFIVGTFGSDPANPNQKLLKIYDPQVQEDPTSTVILTGTFTPTNNNNPLVFSRAANFNGNYFSGSLDDVRLYDAVLTKTEIKDLFNRVISEPSRERFHGANGLVSHWQFENLAFDSKGENNGDVLGPTVFIPGKIEEAASFDNNNGFVKITPLITGTAASSLQLSEFSVAFWVKPEYSGASIPNFHHIISRYNGPGSAGEGGWTFDTLNQGIRFVVTDSIGPRATTSIPLTDGGWKFFVGTFGPDPANPGNNLVQLYEPGAGTLETKTSTGNFDPTNNSQELTFASAANFNGNYFDGDLDEVRVYDKVLSIQEMEALYATQFALAQTGTGLTGMAVDWNQNDVTDPDAKSIDINDLPGCDGVGLDTLDGYDDWDNLQYNMRIVSTFDWGRGTDPNSYEEITTGDVKNNRLVRLAFLYETLLNLPDDVFLPNADTSRKTLLDLTEDADDLIKNNDLNGAIGVLQNMRSLVDGITVIASSQTTTLAAGSIHTTTYDLQDANNDLITYQPAKNQVLAILDSIIGSYEEAEPPCIHDVDCPIYGPPPPPVPLALWIIIILVIVAVEIGIVYYLRTVNTWWRNHWQQALPVIVGITIAIMIAIGRYFDII